jgi:hypothetical protein
MAPSIPLEHADGAIGTLEQPFNRLVATTIRSASPGKTGIPPAAATHHRRTQPEWRLPYLAMPVREVVRHPYLLRGGG